MKNKIFAVSLSVIALSLFVAGGTLAWFQYEDTAVNLVTTGIIRIAVGYTKLQDSSEVLLEPDPDDTLVPGSVRSCIMRVENTGTSPAYIRVKVTKEWIRGGEPAGLPDDNILLDFNGEDWKRIGDWYYYIHPLDKSASTEPLFSELTFACDGVPGVNDNEYQNTVIRLTVVAQAVQKTNRAIEAVWSIDPVTWTSIA